MNKTINKLLLILIIGILGFGFIFTFLTTPKILISFWNTWFLAGLFYAPHFSALISLVYKNSLCLSFVIMITSAYVLLSHKPLFQWASFSHKKLTIYLFLIKTISFLIQMVALLFIAGWMSEGEFNHYRALKPWWFACVLGVFLYVAIAQRIYIFFTPSIDLRDPQELKS